MHAMDMGAGVHPVTHAAQTMLDCTNCSGARSLDCLKHCLEQTDAATQVNASTQTLTNSAVVRCFSFPPEVASSRTPPRIEHETRGSPHRHFENTKTRITFTGFF